MKPEWYIIERIIQVKYLLHSIFRKEKMAADLLPTDHILASVLFSLYPTTRHTSTVRWSPDGHLICLAANAVNSTLWGKHTFFSTSISLAEFNQQPQWPVKDSFININTPDYEQHLV